MAEIEIVRGDTRVISATFLDSASDTIDFSTAVDIELTIRQVQTAIHVSQVQSAITVTQQTNSIATRQSNDSIIVRQETSDI